MGYKIQIDDLVRNATKEETAVLDAQKAEADAQQQAITDALAARESAITKLAKLGLTADEVAALLS
jgi:DNA-binding NarL/FixJ family response regulator